MNANCLLDWKVELEGIEPSSGQSIRELSTCLVAIFVLFELWGGWTTHPDRNLISLEFANSQSALLTILIRDDTPCCRNQKIYVTPKSVHLAQRHSNS